MGNNRRLDKYRLTRTDAPPVTETPPTDNIHELRPVARPPETPVQGEEYRAVRKPLETEKAVRFRIEYSPTHHDTFAYWDLRRVSSVNPRSLTLIFMDDLEIQIVGHNLTSLVEMLQDEEVRSLHLLELPRHAIPQQTDMIITNINYAFPPADQPLGSDS